jgi:hypothetical protein
MNKSQQGLQLFEQQQTESSKSSTVPIFRQNSAETQDLIQILYKYKRTFEANSVPFATPSQMAAIFMFIQSVLVLYVLVSSD